LGTSALFGNDPRNRGEVTPSRFARPPDRLRGGWRRLNLSGRASATRLGVETAWCSSTLIFKFRGIDAFGRRKALWAEVRLAIESGAGVPLEPAKYFHDTTWWAVTVTTAAQATRNAGSLLKEEKWWMNAGCERRGNVVVLEKTG